MKQMTYKPNRETEILEEGTYKNINFIIVSYGTHPCAYIRIPENHKLYNVDYMDSNMEFNFGVHGGITWSGPLPKAIPNKQGFYYGWDYTHCDDYNGYEEKFPISIRTGGKKWTTEEIYEEVKAAIDILIKEE